MKKINVNTNKETAIEKYRISKQRMNGFSVLMTLVDVSIRLEAQQYFTIYRVTEEN